MTPLNRIIGIVGPCGAGKTTLQNALKKLGIQAHHIAQEHSYVANMWQQLIQPDILIYLDVSYETVLKRKKFNFSKEEYLEEKHRLRHAYDHADIIIRTDSLSPHEVLKIVLDFLGQSQKAG